jgi:AraC family transcriptional regulator
MSRHEHKHARFGLVLQGSYTERYPLKERTCGRATLVLHPPNEAHAVAFHDAPVRIFSVHIPPERLEQVRQHGPVLESPADFAAGAAAWLAARLYREFCAMDALAPLVMEGLVLEILGQASRRQAAALPERKRPDWIEEARSLLQDRFAEDLSLGAVARAVGVHPVHLARAFRQHHGSTIGEYLRSLRVEFAARKLSSSDMPLLDIALAAGFSDQSKLSTTFKRAMGMTPTEYRVLFRPR